jgi:ABC-type uncharacterized transport system ATPase subunit
MGSTELVKQRIADAFAANQLETSVVEDIAFHMTDWRENLDELVGLYQNIERLSDGQIRKIVIGFLAHAPNHIAAAKKLAGLGPIEDVFKVGVLEEDR